MEYLEDPIPLHDITVTLGIDAHISKVYLADDGAPLQVGGQAGAWQFTVPKIRFNAIIVCEV
jgi:hypothetical protein